MPNIMWNINTISRCQTAFRGKQLGDVLPAPYYLYVYAISKRAGCTQDELARALFINKSSVARALKELCERGFVERRPNEKDRREMLVYPTQKMLDILPRVREVGSLWTSLLFDGIDKAELEHFESVLNKIRERAALIVTSGGDEI